MSLLQRLDDELKAALKGADRVRLSVIRMLKAAIKNQQIEKGRELTDDEILAVVSTLAKQRRESIDQFSKGGREDLVQQERNELAILQSYLPEQLSPEELDRIILDAINESSAKDEKEIGKIMRVLMPRVKGVADGKVVNARVKELLHPSNK